MPLSSRHDNLHGELRVVSRQRHCVLETGRASSTFHEPAWIRGRPGVTGQRRVARLRWPHLDRLPQATIRRRQSD